MGRTGDLGGDHRAAHIVADVGGPGPGDAGLGLDLLDGDLQPVPAGAAQALGVLSDQVERVETERTFDPVAFEAVPIHGAGPYRFTWKVRGRGAQEPRLLPYPRPTTPTWSADSLIRGAVGLLRE